MMRDYQQVSLEIDEAVAWRRAAEMESSETLARLGARRDDLKGQIEALAADFLVGDSKHVDLPGIGRVQFTDRQPSLRITDHEAFMGALGADERARLVEQKPHINIIEAKKYAETVLAETGEVLPGTERSEARRDAAIQLRNQP